MRRRQRSGSGVGAGGGVARAAAGARGRHGGFALLEVLIAMALLIAGMVGMAAVFASVTSTTHSQADLSEDTALCQSKMETLRALQFTDSSTNTTELNSSGDFPTTGGTGLEPGGSTTTATTGYVDYTDGNGNLLSSSSGATYERLWSIAETTGTAADYKTISVRCEDLNLEKAALEPNLTLVTVMSQ